MNMNLSSYFEEPEFLETLAKYEGMVESHTPTYFDAEELTDIAEYYASCNENEKSDAAIDYALHLHPTHTDALIFKSRSLFLKGKLAEAYQVMHLIEDTSDREVKFLQAELLIEEERIEEADAVLAELAVAEEESLEVLTDITLTFLDANQRKLTKKWIQKIQDKGYDLTNSQIFRDIWCDYCNAFSEHEQAIKAYQLTLNEYPFSVIHWTNLSRCYLALADAEHAHEAVDFALAIEENNEDALAVKAFCHILSENYDEAIALLTKLLPVPRNAQHIYRALVKCYTEKEMDAEAKELCFEWLKHIPNLTSYEKAEIYCYIAMCCYNQLQTEEGMQYIDASLQAEPFFIPAILQKAVLYLQQKQPMEAEKLFQKAIEIVSDDEQAELIYHIADIKQKSNHI